MAQGLSMQTHWRRMSPATWVKQEQKCWCFTFLPQHCPRAVPATALPPWQSQGAWILHLPSHLPSGMLRDCNSLWNKAWPAHPLWEASAHSGHSPHALCKQQTAGPKLRAWGCFEEASLEASCVIAPAAPHGAEGPLQGGENALPVAGTAERPVLTWVPRGHR